MSQGYCDGDHLGYQVDFVMPSNTVVVATAGGTVVEIGSNNTNCPSGCGDPNRDGGIYVKIRHNGRAATWYSSYLHLNRRVVETNDTVQAGQIIGYSGNTGWATGVSGGFHLHFHIRTGPTASDPGVRPTPMQGIEMETGTSPITNFVSGRTYQALDPTNGTLQLLISRATQIEWQSQDSYSYQLFRGTNLGSTNPADWQPVGDRMVGDGNWLAMTVKTDGTSNSFVEGIGYPPDLSKRIVGLRNVDLDTAWTTTEGRTMTIAGMRVQSRDYDLDDYLTVTCDMDFAKHAFLINAIDVAKNVGPTTRGTPWFFFKDSTNGITITNGATVMKEDTTYNLTSTGQTLYVSMQAAQTLCWFAESSEEYELQAFDPFGQRVYSVDYPAGNYGDLVIYAVHSGTYKLKILPRVGASLSLSMQFINGNRRSLRTFTSGQTITSTIAGFYYDYDKFAFPVSAGQTLRLPAASFQCYLSLFSSKGVLLRSPRGVDLIYPASQSDTYFVILWGAAATYSGVVSITP